MGTILNKFRDAINSERLTTYQIENYDYKLALDELLAVDRENSQSILDQLNKEPHFWFGLGLDALAAPQNAGDDYQRIFDLAAQKSATLNREKFNTIINNYSFFGSKPHKYFRELVTGLPLAEQQILLDNPLIIQNLLDTESIVSLGYILGENSDSVMVRALAEENQRLGLLRKINNAALGRWLIDIEPPIALDTDKVQRINEILTTKLNRYALDFDTGYSLAMGEISTLLDLPSMAPVSPAGGVENHIQGDQVSAHSHYLSPNVKTAIQEQYKHNFHLNKFFHQAQTPNDQNFIGNFLALEKSKLFPQDQCEVLLKGFLETNNRNEFLQFVENSSFKDVFVPPLAKQLSTERYNLLRQEVLLTTTYSGEIFKKNRDIIKDISQNFTAIQQIDAPVRDQLSRMRDIKAVEWLNPGFIADAKKNARELRGLTDLARVCDLVIGNLAQLRETCKTQLSYLPTNEQMQSLPGSRVKEIENQRRNLLNQVDQINKRIERYQPLQDLLIGKPEPDNTKNRLVTQGLLKTMEEIGESNNAIELLGFTSTYEDYPNSEKNAHLMKDFPGHKVPEKTECISTSTNSEGVASSYRSAEPIQEGHFREYTINTALKNPADPHSQRIAQGAFIEERAPLAKGSFANAIPPIKLTLSKFPGTGSQGMAYCMAVASQMLVSGMPTKNTPFRLQGSNKEELQYLYAALTVLLKADGNYDKKAIKVISTHYDPQNDKALDKLQKDFRKDTGVKRYLDAWEEINKNKQSGSLQQKDLVNISTTFKQKYNKLIQVTENLAEIKTQGLRQAGKKPQPRTI